MANYTLIGGDQKQYGPVTGEQLRQWIEDGRLNPQSQVKAESDAEWRPLSAFPEFADALAARAAARGAPPPLPSAAPPVPAGASGLAITSLVLGILGPLTCGITALFGLILGVVALAKAKGGRAIAIAGVVVSAFFLLIMPLLLAMLLPALAAAKDRAREISCLNNEKQLAMAVRMYETDNKDQYPPAATWCDAIRSFVGSERAFQCPAGDPGKRCHYAYNAKLDGLDESKVNPNTVLIFETEGDWNVSGGPELMLRQPRHTHGRILVVAFADGHVEAVTPSRLKTLRWDP